MNPTQTTPDGVTETPQNVTPSTNFRSPISKADFNKKYWFNSLQMVTVVNPRKADWPFMVEMRHFIVRAGQRERLPGVIANVYLDQMSKILAQEDDKLSYMTDPNLLRVYYDQLIVDVENLAPEYNPVPEHLRNVPPSVQMEGADETPPWESGMERARDIAPGAPIGGIGSPTDSPTADAETEQPKTDEKPKPETRQFELEGIEYRMVVASNGNKMYYKNGKLCGADDYNKAASML